MKVVDQILHVVVFGAIAYFSPAFSAFAIGCYELAGWHWDVGPITIGQWPPGKPFDTSWGSGVEYREGSVTQMDRVEDLRLDLIFELLGLAIGSLLGTFF